MEPRLFLPSEGSSEQDDVWSWYLNIPLELEEGSLSAEQQECFRAYYRGVGLLRRWRRPFALPKDGRREQRIDRELSVDRTCLSAARARSARRDRRRQAL